MNHLLWKQWRETKGYLTLFTVWMILAVCYASAYELGHHYRAVVGSFSASAWFYGSIASIILAIHVSCGERTSETTLFTAALPISLRRMAAVRLIAAVWTFALPIFIAACLLSIALAIGLVEQAEPRWERSGRLPDRATASLLRSLEQLWSVASIAMTGGIQMLMLLSVAGCWLKRQSQVGLLGAVLALGSVIATGMLWYSERKPILQGIYGVFVPQSLVVHWSYSEDSGSYSDHELAEYRWLSLAFAVVLLVVLGRLFVSQYGKLEVTPKRWIAGRFRFSPPAILSYIPLRFNSRVAAMILLELRQAVPLACFGLILAVLVTIMELLMLRGTQWSFGMSLLAELPHSTFFVGLLWSVVVGSALYSVDLESGIGSFWRSRPIPLACGFGRSLPLV